MVNGLIRDGIGIIERPSVALPLSLSRHLVIDASSRLLTLEQRNSLKGSHSRRRESTAGRRYIAGVALPESLEGVQTSKPALYPQAVTATISEINGTVVRLIEHIRWKWPMASLVKVLETLGTAWDCQAVMVGGPISSTAVPCWRLRRGDQDALVGDGLVRLDLGRDLLEAASCGRAQVYVEVGSPESAGFWSQIIRARRQGQGDDLRVYVEPKGDDGYLVSLALAIEAAEMLVDRNRTLAFAATA